jgi:hypothetical protein
MAYLLVWSAIACVLLYQGLTAYQGLRRNISIAKASGLAYVVVPVFVFSVPWLATYYLWIPILNKLPASLKGLWFEYVSCPYTMPANTDCCSSASWTPSGLTGLATSPSRR